jgi:D-xylose transport system permease protein
VIRQRNGTINPATNWPAEGSDAKDRADGPRIAALDVPDRMADFAIDTTPLSTRQAIAGYIGKLRAGDPGSLPALLGLVVLLILFAALDKTGTFVSLLNLANLMQQGAGATIIAMGLVFVLLTGEIDLAAGTASGLAATMAALHLVSNGNLRTGMGLTLFALTAAGLVIAAACALMLRIWPGVILSAIGLGLLVTPMSANPWAEIVLAVSVGTAVGCLTGFMVAKARMPSFVVTLALFITWQGANLALIGDGGVLALRNPVLIGIANANLSTVASWLLFVLVTVGYAAVVTAQEARRRRRGLLPRSFGIIGIKVGALGVAGGTATYLLTLDRAPGVEAIAGVPYVVPIVLVLLVLGTYVLNHTRFGRHVYAVGGSRESARRAGIDVTRIRASVFIVSSATAAIGGLVYSSKVGAVSPSVGGGNTLLFAVGAAVIGGTSLFGGRGRISNAVIGGAVLATVTNGLGLLRQSSATVLVVTGLVLLLATAVDVGSRHRAGATHR